MVYRMTTAAPVFGLRREIDRLFEDAFSRDGQAWTPAVDVKETESELRLEVELPGIKPEDVEITAENGVLTLRGEKKGVRKEGEQSRYHVIERTYGSFMRTFQLPQGVDEEQISADFDAGVLSLRVPKAALPQPRRIHINAGSNGQRKVSSAPSSESSQRQKAGEVTGRETAGAASR